MQSQSRWKRLSQSRLPKQQRYRTIPLKRGTQLQSRPVCQCRPSWWKSPVTRLRKPMKAPSTTNHSRSRPSKRQSQLDLALQILSSFKSTSECSRKSSKLLSLKSLLMQNRESSQLMEVLRLIWPRSAMESARKSWTTSNMRRSTSSMLTACANVLWLTDRSRLKQSLKRRHTRLSRS